MARKVREKRIKEKGKKKLSDSRTKRKVMGGGGDFTQSSSNGSYVVLGKRAYM